jgi:hypothetical protein
MAVSRKGLDTGRFFALSMVVLVATLSVFVLIKSDHNLSWSKISSVLRNHGWGLLNWKFVGELMNALLTFIWVCILAPTFIAYRVITTPLGSIVLPISYLTCTLSSLFIFRASFTCHGADICGLDVFASIVIFWIGAIACLFPKWK